LGQLVLLFRLNDFDCLAPMLTHQEIDSLLGRILEGNEYQK
jgi:hypothetical protein